MDYYFSLFHFLTGRKNKSPSCSLPERSCWSWSCSCSSMSPPASASKTSSPRKVTILGGRTRDPHQGQAHPQARLHSQAHQPKFQTFSWDFDFAFHKKILEKILNDNEMSHCILQANSNLFSSRDPHTQASLANLGIRNEQVLSYLPMIDF